MFYKRVEQVYDSSDEAPHSIRRLFGHKCQFVRRPADSGQVMEIMVPILVEKGNRKLAQAEKNSLKYRTPSINQLKRKKQEEQGDHKILRAMQEEDLMTDSSMEGVNYQDIKSDGDDQGGETQEDIAVNERNTQATAA